MSMNRDDLVLCAGTLASTPLVPRAEAASAAGFSGMSLFLDDLDAARQSGLSDADIRAVLDDNGLQIAELDPLLTWVGVPGDERVTKEGKGFLRWNEPDFYDAAAAVNARSINAVLFAGDPQPQELLVESFGGLCDRAKEHGLLVHIEFMPFSQINCIELAYDIVTAAGRDNGGIMFDVWHYFRGPSTPEGLRRAAAQVTAIQLDDAPEKAEANVVDETMHRRLLPGDGDADVAELIRILDAGGCDAPPGVEVFCDDLTSLPPLELAKRNADATRRVLAAARG
jgi:sugar phosphate isomerase/epimerase